MTISLSRLDARNRTAGQATYGMFNLRPADTGLPFIVFISQRDDASYAARIKRSPAPKVRAEQMGSYAIAPFAHKAGPKLTTKEEQLLERWVAANRDTLLGYWDGNIEYTQDAIGALVKI